MYITSILGLCAIILAIFLFRGHNTVKKIDAPHKVVVTNKVSPTPMSTNTPTPTLAVNQNSISTAPVYPTAIPTPIKSGPTSTSQQTTNVASWQYPGSRVTGNNTFDTNDDAQTVTNWYKNKIQSLGMHTTTFVQVNTNDNVNNKLSASGNNQQVDISITKSSGDATVHIVVNQ